MFAYVSVWAYVYVTPEKTVSPPVLELQAVESTDIGARDGTSGPLEEQQAQPP